MPISTQYPLAEVRYEFDSPSRRDYTIQLLSCDKNGKEHFEHAVEKPGEQAFSTEWRSVMSKMFPGEKEVFATWFSGHVVIPNGALVNYLHMGYGSTYEKYILLRVENGLIKRKWDTDTAGFIKFREAQFSAFKKTEEYRQALQQMSKGGDLDASQNDNFLRAFYSERYMSMLFDDQP